MIHSRWRHRAHRRTCRDHPRLGSPTSGNPQQPLQPFVHSPDPDWPLGTARWWTRHACHTGEEEYLRTYRPPTSTHSKFAINPHHLPSVAPQQRPTYTPVWPAAQSGPPPLMPQAQPAPSAPFPVPPCSSRTPRLPASSTTSELGYAPGAGSDAQLLPGTRATISIGYTLAHGHPTAELHRVHLSP